MRKLRTTEKLDIKNVYVENWNPFTESAFMNISSSEERINVRIHKQEKKCLQS